MVRKLKENQRLIGGVVVLLVNYLLNFSFENHIFKAEIQLKCFFNKQVKIFHLIIKKIASELFSSTYLVNYFVNRQC